MGNKVTFDPYAKLVRVTAVPVNGEVFIDVKEDLYSDGKEDWRADDVLFMHAFPISAIGGNPLPGSKQLGSTFFLRSDWKIKPYEASHRLVVNGNLYSVDGSSPFTTTDGSFNIFLEQQVSSLVDSTVAQLPEIEYASFNGGISYDETSPYSGVDYPTGTPRQPVNNPYDAFEIAVVRGFSTGFILSDMTAPTDLPLDGFHFVGQGKDRTVINLPEAATVQNCTFVEAEVTGYLDGNNTLTDCLITNLYYVKGFIEQCVLSPGTIVLAGSDVAHFLDCWSGVPGTGTPTIDCGGSGQALAMRNYNGGIRLINKTGPESISIDLNSGQVKLDQATVTAGVLVVRGVGKLIDDVTGEDILSGTYGSLTVLNETVNRDAISAPDPAAIAAAVWDATTGDYVADGSMGQFLQKKLLTVKKFLGLK